MTSPDHDRSLLAPLRYSALLALSDELVMFHLGRGNYDALAVIFDRYQRLVIRVAMQILRDPAEAEDVMQSVFISILETANKFDAARGTVRVWILQYAYHQALNRRRYLNRRGTSDSGSFDVLDLASIVQSRKMPAVEAKRLVQQALAQLSSRQRETLELAFYDGLTMQEIAERTGQSYPNVRHHYYRGLEKLRLLLGRSTPARHSRAATGEEGAYAGS